MTEPTIPAVNAYGNITKALNALLDAPTPPRFTQDFLSTKLAMPGGSAKPVIPFLKKTGFLASDGTPTELYNEFRNADLRGAAAARALKNGFGRLYSYNEYLHDLDDAKLKNVVVQATGLKSDATTVKAIYGSFKALRDFAKFDGIPTGVPKLDTPSEAPSISEEPQEPQVRVALGDLRLGYTINLNLPATTEIEVFNAIFTSLREHLLKE